MIKDKLKPLAKQFFKLNSNVKEIWITEDKHCWYKEMHARQFCGGDKEYFKFTPKDLVAKKEPKPKAAPKAQAPKDKEAK